jgi:DNA/RNA endonuclease YhcR with UshA esterase domain
MRGGPDNTQGGAREVQGVLGRWKGSPRKKTGKIQDTRKNQKKGKEVYVGAPRDRETKKLAPLPSGNSRALLALVLKTLEKNFRQAIHVRHLNPKT